MAPEISAGAVLVELKAQYQDLKKNVQGAKNEMAGFGASVDATAKKVTTSGQQISNSFDVMDKKSIQLIAKMTKLTGVLFAAQGAFSALSGGEGNQNKGVTAATTALTSFAAIAIAMPHPVGLALGAVVGLTAGILKFIETAPKGTEAAKAFGDAMKKAADAQRDLHVDLAFIARTKTGTERDQALNAIQRKAQEDIIREQLLDQVRTRDVFQRGEISADVADRLLQDAEDQIKAARNKLRDIMASESVKDREALAIANKILLDGTALQLNAGLIDPLQALQVEAQAARKELELLLSQPGASGTDIGLAIDKVRGAQAKVQDRQRLESIADNFGGAISRSLSDAILNQRKPMEALANLGGALFENALNDAMKNLQTGIADAIKGLGGGSAAAGALTGILGIGGALLSRIGNKSSEKFSGVKSIVTDSTPVRGIVAGPANVAVAQVGDDIARAMAPVVQVLRVIAGSTSKIEQNTRGSGGGGFAAGGAAVALPTA